MVRLHNKAREPLAQHVARLVCLYRQQLPPRRWPSTKPEPASVEKLLSSNVGRIRESIVLATAGRKHMSAPMAATSAFAFLLLDDGHSPEDIRRYLAPTDGLIETDDPRIALWRTMRLFGANHDAQPDYLILGYLLKGWNLWVTGRLAPTIHWTHDEGMPRIASWPPSTDLE